MSQLAEKEINDSELDTVAVLSVALIRKCEYDELGVKEIKPSLVIGSDGQARLLIPPALIVGSWEGTLQTAMDNLVTVWQTHKRLLDG